uniref:NR LBD domain-containing protein n=1 Tax=Caenorhabditis tropicalis TaxID=1561998 RepID=A0A1I7THC3_9PELO
MNPRAVQSEREQKGSPLQDEDDYKDMSSPDTCSVEIQTDVDDSQKDLPSMEAEMARFSEQLVEMHRAVCSYVDPPDVAKQEEATAVVFMNAFFNPGMMSPRTPLVITGERVATVQDVMDEWRRNFVLFSDWLRALPEFNQLTIQDQIVLAKNRYGPFHWWLCANWTVQAGCDGVCYSNGAYFPRKIEEQCVPDVKGSSARMFESLSTPIRELQLDETEIVLMLAVILFSDEVTELADLSQPGKDHVRVVGNRFVRMLHHHVNSKDYGERMEEDETQSESLAAVRIAKMMILLSATTNLVYLTSDNIQLMEVLHVVPSEYLCHEVQLIHNSYQKP